MSRIGKLPISIPAGVTVTLKDGIVNVKGPKGELSQKVDPSIKVKIEDGHVSFEIDENSPVNVKQKQAFHGLYRSLVNNMVIGVSEGFKKELELVGVGYKARVEGSHKLVLSLGFSHDVNFEAPKEINLACPSPTQITISGADKQLVGQIAAEIRKYRKPEPYKGKGVKYTGEYVRRKEGKKK